MFNFTSVCEALITLICAIITAFVIPYLKSKTTAQQQTALIALVKIAVAAAEQIFDSDSMGAEKKAYVLSWLEAHGVTVDAEKLNAMIESAVYDLKKGV